MDSNLIEKTDSNQKESDKLTQQPQERNEKTKNILRIPKLRIEKIIRIIIILIGTSFMIINYFYGQFLPHYEETYCFIDVIQNSTEGINNSFYNNKLLNYTIKFIFSLLIDLSIVYTFIVWSLFGSNIRLITSGISYMFLNIVARFIHKTVQPKNSAFYSNFAPSIFVNYQQTTYSFYPVVIGLIIICAFEWKRNNNIYFFWFFIALFIFESLIMIILRGHFFHEVFSATITGHYSFLINEIILTKIYGKYYFGPTKESIHIKTIQNLNLPSSTCSYGETGSEEKKEE